MIIKLFENNGVKLLCIGIIFSMAMAFIAKLLEISFPRKLADIFIILVFIMLALYRYKFKNNDAKVYNRLFILFSPIIIINIIYILFNFYSNRPLLSGSGFTGLSVNIYIFTFIILIYNISLVDLNKIITYILIFHILYILIETFFLLMGFQYIFYDITNEYRHLPGVLLNKFFNIQYNVAYKDEIMTYEFGGANSIFVAAQAASQLLLTSIIWFCPFYRFNITEISQEKRIIFFFLSLLLFPLTSSGLTLLLLVLSLALVLVLFKQELLNINKKNITIAIGLTYLFLFNKVNDIIFYRFKELSISSKYYNIFMDPVFRFMDLSAVFKIFGMQDDKTGLTYTDFGLGSLIWSSGLLMGGVSIVMMICLLGASYKALKAPTRKNEMASMTSLGIYSLICIIWWLSTIHYLVSINVGGKQTFALFISALLTWNIKNE